MRAAHRRLLWRRAAVVIVILAVVAVGCSDGRQAPPAPPAGAPVGRSVFVALGGHETFGGADGPGATWAQALHRKLPLGTVYINVARPEATAADARRNQLPLAIAQRPTLAVVWLGDGDEEVGTPPEVFGENLMAVLSGLRGAGVDSVLVGSPTPGTRGSRYADQIATASQAMGAKVVPLPAGTSPGQRTPEARAAANDMAAGAFAAALAK